MKKILLTIFLTIWLQACTLGPIKIEKREEQLPKIYITSGFDDCKFRIRRKKQVLKCEYEF